MKKLKGPAISWFTTLKTDNNKRKQLILTKTYNEKDYQNYDIYPAINVDKIKDIPKDYYKPIGVPLTILCYNLDDWSIIDQINRYSFFFTEYNTKGKLLTEINNKAKYIRIIIQRKDNREEK